MTSFHCFLLLVLLLLDVTSCAHVRTFNRLRSDNAGVDLQNDDYFLKQDGERPKDKYDDEQVKEFDPPDVVEDVAPVEWVRNYALLKWPPGMDFSDPAKPLFVAPDTTEKFDALEEAAANKAGGSIAQAYQTAKKGGKAWLEAIRSKRQLQTKKVGKSMFLERSGMTSQSKSQLRVQSKSKSKSHLQLHSGADQFSKFPLKRQPLTSAQWARRQIRGGKNWLSGKASDGAYPRRNNFILDPVVVGKQFTSRVRAATFGVTPPATVAAYNAAAAGSWAQVWCDAAWNPAGYPGVAVDDRYWQEGAQGSRIRPDWQRGHIIGRALGGDKDPMNMFPQFRGSNAEGSVWWRMEQIALAVKNTIPTQNVMVFIDFNYANEPPVAGWVAGGAHGGAPNGVGAPAVGGVMPGFVLNSVGTTNGWVPLGGTYEIRISVGAYGIMAGPSGIPTLGAYAEAFFWGCQWPGATPATATTFARPDGCSLKVSWANTHNHALKHAPIAPLDRERFQVQPELFP